MFIELECPQCGFALRMRIRRVRRACAGRPPLGPMVVEAPVCECGTARRVTLMASGTIRREMLTADNSISPPGGRGAALSPDPWA